MTVPVAEPAGPEVNLPLALVGAAITLPAGIVTRERFYEIIKEKRQVRRPDRFIYVKGGGKKTSRSPILFVGGPTDRLRRPT